MNKPFKMHYLLCHTAEDLYENGNLFMYTTEALEHKHSDINRMRT